MIQYSEIFGRTIQGEAHYNGRISNWIRFFSCNLECNGFGQKDPCNPESYRLDYQEFDANKIQRIEDLPVFQTGCDSSYSWSKKFKHLAKKNTAIEIAEQLTNLNYSENNLEKLWTHPVTGNSIHLCFTGGEPMMQQDAIIEILSVLISTRNYPKFITIETNGTKKLKGNFVEFVKQTQEIGIEWLFSISPKLFTVSGELPVKAWKPEIIKSYSEISDKCVCKFVVNENSFEELLLRVQELKEQQNLTSVEFWAMPVGATEEQQSTHSVTFIEKLIDCGFHIADRTHARLFSNVIGK